MSEVSELEVVSSDEERDVASVYLQATFVSSVSDEGGEGNARLLALLLCLSTVTPPSRTRRTLIHEPLNLGLVAIEDRTEILLLPLDVIQRRDDLVLQRRQRQDARVQRRDLSLFVSHLSQTLLSKGTYLLSVVSKQSIPFAYFSSDVGEISRSFLQFSRPVVDNLVERFAS